MIMCLRHGKQLYLLLWKNFNLQRRRWIVTLIEIFVPAVFAFLLVYIRYRVDGTVYDKPTFWDPFSVDKLPPFPTDYSNSLSISFTPEIRITRKIIDKVLRSNIGLHGAWGFDSEDAMVNFLVQGNVNTSARNMLGGIVFSSFNVSEPMKIPANITYKIRLPYASRSGIRKNTYTAYGGEHSWMTGYTFPIVSQNGPRHLGYRSGGAPGYYAEGFLALQRQLDRAILGELIPPKMMAGVPTEHVEVKMQRMPYPPFLKDAFTTVIQNYMSIIIMLAYVFGALNVASNVIHEKEMKLKAYMKLMGLQSWLHWTAWFINFFIVLSLSAVIVIGCFYIKFGEHGSVITYSDASVVFVFFLLFISATIFLAFAASVFFDKARTGTAATFLIYFLSFLPYPFIQPRYHSMSLAGKMLACLSPNLAMCLGCQLIGMFEGTETGVLWSNLARGISVDDSFTMLHVFAMFIVDCIIFMIIAWYKETVMPGEYGSPQPWYFPITRSYWAGPRSVLDPSSVGAAVDSGLPEDETSPLVRGRSSTAISANAYSANFEPDPSGLPCSVRIQDLSKVFGRGAKAKVAVNNMNLNIFEGQITALLGHNGAGKTTTMSMIAGFIPSTRGTIVINGMDIRQDLVSVRRFLGLCPQHDILFNNLTVEEHLRFFAKLKDCPPELVEAEVDRMLAATRMEPKRLAFAQNLSGGMRRKLSVAIALIGGSRIVILDEPSSGMDPNARRELWTFLQNERANRTMLLSTHFMDEADVLGDRIAIMAAGVVQCAGSSLFLKSRFGAGYHLTMVKTPRCDVQAVMELVMRLVPAARPESHISDELSVHLPTEAVASFELLFNEIEARKAELGIASYGACMTSMEEVFLRVGENEDIQPPDTQPLAYSSSRSSSVSSINLGAPSTSSLNDVETISEARSLYEEEHNLSLSLLVQQFWAIIVKRFLLSCRSYIISIAQLLVPVCFACVGLAVLKTWPGPTDSPPLALTLEKFASQVISYGYPFNSTLDEFSNAVVNAYHAQFYARPDTRFLYLNDLPEDRQKGYQRALADIAAADVSLFNREIIIGAYFSQKNSSKHDFLSAVVLFNNQPYHSPAIALNALSNAVLRAALDPSYGITVINHPQPLTITDRAAQMSVDYTTGFTVALNVVFGMSFLAASFTVIIIRERVSKVKHLHYVSGTNKFIYWVAMFSWDYFNFLLPCIFMVFVFLGFNEKAYSCTPGRTGGVFLFLCLYGWSALPLMYLAGYLFASPSSGLVWMTVINVASGLGPLILVTVLDSLKQLGINTTTAYLRWMFLVLSPSYSLGQGLYDIYSNDFYERTCTMPEIQFICDVGTINMTCCPNRCAPNCAVWNDNFLGWAPQGIGRELVFLAAQGFVFLTVCLAAETSLFARVKNAVSPQRLRALHLMQRLQMEEAAQPHGDEDADVADERRHVLETPRDALKARFSLVLHEMTRFYGDHCAVDRLSCVVSRGDCFGLLGVNGAGKTTTFRMLTGDLGITAGDAFVNGASVRHSLRQVQRMLGYCPQFDALLDNLTGRETLTLFARLRGLRDELIAGEIETLTTMLLLKPLIDLRAGTYSGGNKRKLSTALALVGGPPVVCLDEPTTGMDPIARRHVWRALSHYRDRGRTLVLTSHSMEECEALCTKIAIMVNGQFKCFGSCQQLKAKYGRGYTLLAQVNLSKAGVERETLVRNLMDFASQKLPSAELKDVHQGLVHYHLHPHHSLCWASVFALMERYREALSLENYSVSQTTLEQVFLTFARAQVHRGPEVRSSCCGLACAGRLLRRCCLRCCLPPEVAPELSVNA